MRPFFSEHDRTGYQVIVLDSRVETLRPVVHVWLTILESHRNTIADDGRLRLAEERMEVFQNGSGRLPNVPVWVELRMFGQLSHRDRGHYDLDVIGAQDTWPINFIEAHVVEVGVRVQAGLDFLLGVVRHNPLFLEPVRVGRLLPEEPKDDLELPLMAHLVREDVD